MRIREIHLRGIGVFDDETISFPAGVQEGKAEIHILTGENGTGKSTVLVALAGAFDHSQKAPDRFQGNCLHKRLRSFEYFQEGTTDDEKWKSNYKVWFDDDTQTFVVGSPDTNHAHESRISKSTRKYREMVAFGSSVEIPLKFGVFAYSGYRHIEAGDIVSVGAAHKFNPLAESLEFVKPASETSGYTMNNWIANSISKSAVERERDPRKSERFASAVRSLESALSEITSYKVKFTLRTDPFDLLIELNGIALDFDVLPDGLRSLISWIGDLLMRIDSLKWNDDLPAFEKKLILLLDEIEVHLHPAWQRKVLPVVQRLFKNSQIFVSTHSPFVVNSVDGAWIHQLRIENGSAHSEAPIPSEDGNSYRFILREIFGITEDFGVGAQLQLEKFTGLRDQVLSNKNGTLDEQKESLKRIAKELASQSVELNTIVQFELRQLSKSIGEEISI